MTLRTDLIIDSFWLNTFCLVWQNVGMCAFHIVKLSALPYMNMFCIHFNIIGAIGILRNLGSHIPCPVTKWKMHQFVPGPPEIREHSGHAIRYENKIVCKIPLIYIVSGKKRKNDFLTWIFKNDLHLFAWSDTQYRCLTECIATFTWHLSTQLSGASPMDWGNAP